MAKQGKPEGNKRQRERDKRRKKAEKAARRLANTGGQAGPGTVDANGEPVDSEPGDGEARPTDSSLERDDNEDASSLREESVDANLKRVP